MEAKTTRTNERGREGMNEYGRQYQPENISDFPLSDGDYFCQKISGKHKSISWSVTLHGFPPNKPSDFSMWTLCFYVFVNVNNLSEETLALTDLPHKTFGTKNQYKHFPGADTPFYDLPWHCGMTYSEKKFDAEGVLVGFEFGCDYGHAWDFEQYYSWGSVKQDAIDCVEAMFAKGLIEKVWCCGNGNWYPPSEGEFIHSGQFQSHEAAEIR